MDHSAEEEVEETEVEVDLPPSWVDPLMQGIEDAELLGMRRRSIECSAITARIVGSEIRKEKSPYVLYIVQVVAGTNSWKIKRRYTDFVYLHQQLNKAFTEPKLPSLPPKQFLGSSLDPAFIEQRGKSLQGYLDAIFTHENIWVRSDLVRFLDNESSSLMFIWNLERMRKMQELLNTMTIDNNNKTDLLTTELVSANKQVQELQDRIARMEMFFLQHATGRSPEKLSESSLRSISGNKPIEAEFLSAGSNQRPHASSDPEADHVISEIENDCEVIDRALEAAMISHASSKTSLPSEQVLQVLDMASGRTKSRALSTENMKRISTDEITSLALSRQLQEAVRISDELFNTYAETTKVLLPSTPSFAGGKVSRIEPLTPRHFDSPVLSCVDSIVSSLVPAEPVLGIREAVSNYVKGVSLVTLKALVLPIGMFCRDSFTVNGDMDLTLCLAPAQFRRWYVKINEALCTSSLLSDSTSQRINVENVKFVSEDMKIVKAVINGVSVDITANNINAVYHQALLEKISEFVGQDHLFKRSLLLLKAWLYFESPRYVAGTTRCFGETVNGISSMALSVMLVHLFNVHGAAISHPLHSLGLFLDYFSAVDWNTTAITVDALVSSEDCSNPTGVETTSKFFPVELLSMYKRRLDDLRLYAFKLEAFAKIDDEVDGTEVDDAEVELEVAKSAINQSPDLVCEDTHPYIGRLRKSPSYVKGALNIIDPIDCVTNLCGNVDANTLSAIETALKGGQRSLSQILSSDVGKIKSFFELTSSYIKENIEESSNSSVSTFLMTNFEELDAFLEIMELILASVPSSGGLLRVIVYILEHRGPLPVGEIGKQLLELTGSDILVKNIKSKFTGLKKCIEMHSEVFSLGTDHPFNPIVSLLPNRKPLQFPICPVSVPYPSLALESFLPSKASNAKDVKPPKKSSSLSREKGTAITIADAPASPQRKASGSEGGAGNGGRIKKPVSPSNRHAQSMQYQNSSTVLPYVLSAYPLYGFQPGHPNPMMAQPYMPYPLPYPMMYAPAPLIDAYGNMIPPPQQAPVYYNAAPSHTTTDTVIQSEILEQNADEQTKA